MNDKQLIEIEGIIRNLEASRFCLSYNDEYWEGDGGFLKNVIHDIRHYDENPSNDDLAYIRSRLLNLNVQYEKEPTYKKTMIQSTLPTARIYWLLAELLVKIEVRLGIGID